MLTLFLFRALASIFSSDPLRTTSSKMSNNSGMGKMHLDLYTNNAALTQKAKFWCNFVSSLKGKKNRTRTTHVHSLRY